MSTAFQTDAFQTETVWPQPAEVLDGVSYGPNGVDYTGTYAAGTLVPSDISAIALAAAESVWSYTR